ncbi:MULTISPECIES: ABC transporter ATP-binding protein [unclassified Actinopolyspora]|uniref:energy-coupling factor ABC transporter ATP-binding protein n=1 Tax=unclassified Actinopolyspora TaxID=2639451 RepID=UPI0013F5C630|nr:MULTISPECIES: ABC transporter ATP-binding protein [unclassified Actinopolyspora]NHD17749.1 ABC transporter ATP-binding protein [Actinopolyspora sp. BKK2]NHE76518.1 ABC transporter ATP-binding protein [Actinopolyspora sp. BKK1]
MTPPALAVRELSARYTDAPRRAVDTFSLDIAAGEIVGVLGPTGAGKTTLLKCLSGVIPHHDEEAAAKGRIEICGVDLDDLPSLAAITEQIGLVLQDPELQLVNTTVREELAWGMENRGLPVPQIRSRIDRAAELFDIAALLDRFTHALSGGEKQRVVVASIFCLSPRIMLLDEPTSELDPAGTESVLDAIKVLADEGVTVVVVEHKVEELALYADRLVVMQEGVARQIGTPREVLVSGHAPYRPQVLDVATRLDDEGYWPVDELPLSVSQAARAWAGWHRQGGQE